MGLEDDRRDEDGQTLGQWSEAKAEIRALLVERARSSRTISYQELAQAVASIRLTPDAGALASLLREISSEEDAAGRGMLSAVVVRRAGKRLPGSGFFRLADLLGRDTSDRQAFWQAEFERVTRVWQEP